MTRLIEADSIDPPVFVSELPVDFLQVDSNSDDHPSWNLHSKKV